MNPKVQLMIAVWCVAVGALIAYAVWKGISAAKATKRKRDHDAAIAAAKAQGKKPKSNFQRSMDRAIYHKAVRRGATPAEAIKAVKIYNDKLAQRDTVNNG